MNRVATITLSIFLGFVLTVVYGISDPRSSAIAPLTGEVVGSSSLDFRPAVAVISTTGEAPQESEFNQLQDGVAQWRFSVSPSAPLAYAENIADLDHRVQLRALRVAQVLRAESAETNVLTAVAREAETPPEADSSQAGGETKLALRIEIEETLSNRASAELEDVLSAAKTFAF